MDYHAKILQSKPPVRPSHFPPSTGCTFNYLRGVLVTTATPGRDGLLAADRHRRHGISTNHGMLLSTA